MLLRKRIGAFTLAETLVALVLMLIIVGLAASILTIASENIQLIKENELGYQEMEQLEFLLTLDMNTYETIRRTDSVIYFSNPIDSIQYRFKNNVIENKTWIIRNNDTLAHLKLHFYTYHKAEESNVAIDAIKIESILTNDFIFNYRKEDLKTKLLSNGF
ncbi:type II secretion system protein J [Nonlabens ulvanivorans]|uniref:type II secretion system protein J n=1 Tax=Nonlabens ulvanivorans TaxID=906888 RepID=UPI0037C5483B